MIDDLSILISTAMCLFIVFRAVRLDRAEPWYGKRRVTPVGANTDATEEAAVARSWRTQRTPDAS